MGLVLKHIERIGSGIFQYRRRVPKDVSGIITKREFKRKLGVSEKEALAAWPQYHAAVEREIETARKRLALVEAVSSGTVTEREVYAEALRRRADMIAAGTNEEGLSIAADLILDSYPHVEGRPIGVPLVDRHTVNLLRNGPDIHKAPAC